MAFGMSVAGVLRWGRIFCSRFESHEPDGDEYLDSSVSSPRNYLPISLKAAAFPRFIVTLLLSHYQPLYLLLTTRAMLELSPYP